MLPEITKMLILKMKHDYSDRYIIWSTALISCESMEPLRDTRAPEQCSSTTPHKDVCVHSTKVPSKRLHRRQSFKMPRSCLGFHLSVVGL